jgi:hypothetical protein
MADATAFRALAYVDILEIPDSPMSSPMGNGMTIAEMTLSFSSLSLKLVTKGGRENEMPEFAKSSW